MLKVHACVTVVLLQNKAQLLAAKSPVLERVDQTVTAGVRALDEVDNNISRLNETSRMLAVQVLYSEDV